MASANTITCNPHIGATEPIATCTGAVGGHDAPNCPNGDQLFVIEVHSIRRVFCLFGGSTPGTPVPLLIYLHDDGGAAANTCERSLP